MHADFTNFTVLVTGGAVRIGRAICLAFARRGARVVVHCHNSRGAAAELLAAMPPHPGGHRMVAGDLADPAFRQRLIPDLQASGVGVNCLINNASVYRRMPLAQADEILLREDFEINFIAPFMLMRDFANRVGAGCIINLLDQRVSRVERGAGGYGLAKKSLRDATEAAALEWAPDIRVNAVAPGFSLPPPGVSEENMIPLLANVPMRMPSSPGEVAAACLFLASSPTVTGQIVYVDGGMHLASLARPEKLPS